MTLTPQDLARILALAEKATPGPWAYVYECSGDFEVFRAATEDHIGVAWSKDAHFIGLGEHSEQNEGNARFIAALDPATVIALVRMAQGGEG